MTSPRALLVSLSFLLTVPMFAQGAKILVRTFCTGSDCVVAERLGALVPPMLSPDASVGVLTVKGEDPIARCAEHLDRSRVPEVTRCVRNWLSGTSNAEAIKEGGYDAVLVQILSKDKRHGQVQGTALFFGKNGMTYETPVTFLAVRDGDRYYAPVDTAPPETPVVIDMGLFNEIAASLGLQHVPQRRIVYEFRTPVSSGSHAGVALVPMP